MISRGMLVGYDLDWSQRNWARMRATRICKNSAARINEIYESVVCFYGPRCAWRCCVCPAHGSSTSSQLVAYELVLIGEYDGTESKSPTTSPKKH